MGDKPSRYWDLEECRWVRYDAPAQRQPRVPEQAAPADEPTAVSRAREADVRSG